MVVDARLLVTADMTASSARVVTGAVSSQSAPFFLIVVVSPDAAFTRISSILSACSAAKTFSCFVSASVESVFFQVTK